MTFRTKLVLLFTASVVAVVAAIGLVVALSARRTLERVEQQRTEGLVAQFRAELARHGAEVARAADATARAESVVRMAADLARGGDRAAYARQAEEIARTQGLDFLEFVLGDGTIISSAQWVARFGYRDATLPSPAQLAGGAAFLKNEELPQGSVLVLTAVRPVVVGEFVLYSVAGKPMDAAFLQSLVLPRGMRVLLYRNAPGPFAPERLIGGELRGDPRLLADVVDAARREKRETARRIEWSNNAADAENMRALPLTSAEGDVPAVLLIGNSRREAVELERRIALASVVIGFVGIVIGVAASALLAVRITRPVEQLAAGAREISLGNLQAHVEVASHDELGELAESFNRMSRELVNQRERLVQAERVAAWRELARRLAHELKNPLFPLQLTVENLQRARATSPDQFNEVFDESTATLAQELANMKAIVGRFSDFAKMPRPEMQRVPVNEIVERVVQLARVTIEKHEPAIEMAMQLAPSLPLIAADPDLLYRAVQNLVLNAIDAMPNGGTLTVQTRTAHDAVRLEVIDTGGGLTQEECNRLFTPYYTTKQHGTGLGLAIVQSIVSDHGGKIGVTSAPGRGATFAIELPISAEGRATHA